MKILAIETSCDETAISYIEAKNNNIKVLGNALLSQVKIHEKYGGVFPMIAKREHCKTLIPLLEKVLKEAKEIKINPPKLFEEKSFRRVKKILEKEPELLARIIPFLKKYSKPKIDYIAVTYGPGLEPALWVGINFAKVLSLVWNIPLIPVNHMEGHIFSAFLEKKGKDNLNFKISNLKFPILALLISGGHTELVLVSAKGGPASPWKYEIIGETRDDAVGEAFDKVGRMLNLKYPGGPEISRLAENARASKFTGTGIKLPRPMINSETLDFSYAGLKTAVLYLIKKLPKLSSNLKTEIALEFENSATDTLIAKTKKALVEIKAKALVIGGGVSANIHIRREFKKMTAKEFPSVKLHIPKQSLTTDNALMIALAGYLKIIKNKNKVYKNIRAEGNLRLA
ncbi:MAG: tRNA (adenosine(37)-N6)-threonylcarbamoyltransferase complex transferase subunit TsaD [Patescibacteria group bacterium]